MEPAAMARRCLLEPALWGAATSLRESCKQYCAVLQPTEVAGREVFLAGTLCRFCYNQQFFSWNRRWTGTTSTTAELHHRVFAKIGNVDSYIQLFFFVATV